MTKDQRQHSGANVVFSINDITTTGHPHAKKKKIKLHTDFTFCTKINSK